jgi:hypothetical protein
MHAAAASAIAAALITALVAARAGGQGAKRRTMTLAEVAKGASLGLVDNPPRRLNREGEP